MKFAHVRVSEHFTFAEQIFHSEAISLARRANFVVKNHFCLVDKSGFLHGGGCWDRTSDLYDVNVAL